MNNNSNNNNNTPPSKPTASVLRGALRYTSVEKLSADHWLNDSLSRDDKVVACLEQRMRTLDDHETDVVSVCLAWKATTTKAESLLLNTSLSKKQFVSQIMQLGKNENDKQKALEQSKIGKVVLHGKRCEAVVSYQENLQHSAPHDNGTGKTLSWSSKVEVATYDTKRRADAILLSNSVERMPKKKTQPKPLEAPFKRKAKTNHSFDKSKCVKVGIFTAAATKKGISKPRSILRTSKYEPTNPLPIPACHFDVSEDGRSEYRASAVLAHLRSDPRPIENKEETSRVKFAYVHKQYFFKRCHMKKCPGLKLHAPVENPAVGNCTVSATEAMRLQSCVKRRKAGVVLVDGGTRPLKRRCIREEPACARVMQEPVIQEPVMQDPVEPVVDAVLDDSVEEKPVVELTMAVEQACGGGDGARNALEEEQVSGDDDAMDWELEEQLSGDDDVEAVTAAVEEDQVSGDDDAMDWELEEQLSGDDDVEAVTAAVEEDQLSGDDDVEAVAVAVEEDQVLGGGDGSFGSNIDDDDDEETGTVAAEEAQVFGGGDDGSFGCNIDDDDDEEGGDGSFGSTIDDDDDEETGTVAVVEEQVFGDDDARDVEEGNGFTGASLDGDNGQLEAAGVVEDPSSVQEETQVVIEITPLRRSARVAARLEAFRPPRRSARLAAKGLVCYKRFY